MERKVGEIFEYNGEWYQCVEQPKQYDCATVCELCAFSAVGNCKLDKCSGTYRSDGKSVIFKKLEKVGEPIRVENKLYQKIKAPCALCDHCAFYDNFSRDCKLSYYINHYPAYSCLTNEMFVEVKQNKENMEEKKLNLRPFDLEAAKAGKPVCTRDGRKARIICFDAKRKDGKNIMALIPDKEYPGFEDLVAYPNNGNYHGGHENDGDLMMLHQKKEGWINIYTCYDGAETGISIYKTKEIAKKEVDNDSSYLDTIEIEWEE